MLNNKKQDNTFLPELKIIFKNSFLMEKLGVSSPSWSKKAEMWQNTAYKTIKHQSFRKF